MLLKKSLYGIAMLCLGGLISVTKFMPYEPFSIAHALEVKKKPIAVMAVYARASLGNLKNSAAFMSIINHTEMADKVISASSDIAKRVELHTHIKEGDIMKMRKVEAFDVPAQGFVDLEPGSHHIMLIGLHKPLKAGDKFPLTLKFEKNGVVTVEVLVKSLKKMSHEEHHRGSMSGASGEKKQERGSHH